MWSYKNRSRRNNTYEIKNSQTRFCRLYDKLPNAKEQIPFAYEDFSITLNVPCSFRYLNYGSLAMVIGHEITHGFDGTGSVKSVVCSLHCSLLRYLI